MLAERPGAEKARRERLLALNEQVAGRQVRAALDELKIEFGDTAGVESYHQGRRPRSGAQRRHCFSARVQTTASRSPSARSAHPRFTRYRAHVMAASGATPGAPVVAEANPTYANIFGRVESAAVAKGTPPKLDASSPAHCIRRTAVSSCWRRASCLPPGRRPKRSPARWKQARFASIRPSEPVALGSTRSRTSRPFRST